MTAFYLEAERKAAQAVADLLALPDAEPGEISSEGTFDPWTLFPGLYGSYSSTFDQCALDVLREVLDAKKVRDDLGAEMFREMLCTANLCDYGSSPRYCFPTTGFKPLLPDLICRWEAYTLLVRGEDPTATNPSTENKP